MESFEKVTIYIPTYNSEKTIKKTLDSLLDQTYKNFVIKVFDNNSYDRTIEIISSFKSEKIKIYKSDHTVPAEENYNKCIRDFKTRLACIYHSDDIYDKRIIQKQINFLKNKNILAAFVDGHIINEEDQIIGSIISSKKVKKQKTITQINLIKFLLKHSNFLITPSVMIDTKKFKKYKIGFFLHNQYKDSADLDMWLRLSKYEDGIGILDEQLISYRHSSQQLSYKHRTAIKKSTFFYVIEDYLKKKEIITCLNKNNYNDLKILKLRDYILIVNNLILLNRLDDAFIILKKIKYQDTINLLRNIKGLKGLLLLFFAYLKIQFKFIKKYLKK